MSGVEDRTQHVIDAIDGALADDEFPDAMRWSPEPEAVKGAPAPFDGSLVWQPPQRYEQAGRPASPAERMLDLLGDDGIPVGLEHRRQRPVDRFTLDRRRRRQGQEPSFTLIDESHVWVAPAGTPPDVGEWTNVGYLVDEVAFEPRRPTVADWMECFERVGQLFAEMSSAFSAVFTPWSETIEHWRRQYECRPMAPERPEPEDPRERALRLRRNRNTGPSRDLTRQRPPRRLP